VRRLLTPRWLCLHALAVVLVAACCWLGWWQLGRGLQGSARSLAYALQWPGFAAFVAVMWWRIVRDSRPPGTRRDERPGTSPERPSTAEGREVRAGPVLHTRPVPDPGEQDDELAAYNRYLAALNRNAEPR
jgi:DNA-binding transcriptional regulator of glucitol operon